MPINSFKNSEAQTVEAPVITLPYPPTINHYYTVARGRKILSKRGRDYKKVCWAEIMLQGGAQRVTGDVCVFIRAYPPDQRKRDLDNILKPILDVLTTSEIYQDDSQVVDLRIQKFNPSKPGRVEVIVSGLSETGTE